MALLCLDTLATTVDVECQLVVNSRTVPSCVKKLEPKIILLPCYSGRPAALIYLASLRILLILIGIANVDNSVISDTTYTLQLR